MSETNFSNGVVVTNLLTWGGGAAPALGKYSYSVPSDPVDNSANLAQTPLSYRHAMLRLVFSTIQSASSMPLTKLGLFLLPLVDGTNVAVPPGTLAMPPVGTTKRLEVMITNDVCVVPGYQIIDFGDPAVGFPLGPFKYALQLYNGSGYSWTVAPTATLYRWNSIVGAMLNQPSTFEGTMAVSAATSEPLTTANVILSPNSAALPAAGALGNLTIINIGTNPVYVSWFGGTASASDGCELLNAGAGDTVNLTGSLNPPTFFSPLGTTISFHN